MQFLKVVMMFGLSILAVSKSEAQIWESLVTPGDLSKAHAEYEDQCQECHDPFKKANQDKLCIACHEEIGEDLRAQRGYHGHNPDISQTVCKSCHTEHLGTDAKIAQLDFELFRHTNTGFELAGAHQEVACNQCHNPNEPYRDTGSTCSACHSDADPHKEQLGLDCENCHSEESWGSAKFDHTETEFDLVDSHLDVPCSGCHIGGNYSDALPQCVSCHAVNDVHGAEYGDSCDRCHGSKNWIEIRFDHDKQTDFPLLGSHKNGTCVQCHGEGLPVSEEVRRCVDCHEVNDYHKGRNGPQCESCHDESTWAESSFDHDSDTGFTLAGLHRSLQCGACHKGSEQLITLDNSCIGCHRADDIHEGQQGRQCERCHQQSAWGESIRFSHEITKFPLLGLHAVVPCEECHLDATFQDADTHCVSCHREDDSHKQGLGDKCRACHNPNGWAFWEFDHDQTTGFLLDGSHRGLQCIACHSTAEQVTPKTDRSCSSCHSRDDEHDGKFGRHCGRCHFTDLFERIRM